MAIFTPHTQWDIFCSVIDNYGDIGVCWRLARQLANEQQQNIRLWVDDLTSFQKICPLVNPEKTQQYIDNIAIHQWHKNWQSIEPADIIIEAFACPIPSNYLEAMGKANKKIFWVNLDYLTYENWSIDFHGLSSPQPHHLNKYFFFPGLEQTGGLIRESNLFTELESFQNNSLAQQQFLAQLGVTKHSNSFLILLFSYANPNINQWLDTLKQSKQPYQLLIPQTPLLKNIADYLQIEVAKLSPLTSYSVDNLTFHIIPFVAQEHFDKLLNCVDYNLIRGEDSFVRAQYAGKPMLWHIYPQQENTHLIKLKAFLDYYLTDLPTEAQQATIDWWLAWNNQQNMANAWFAYQQYLPALKKHAKNWQEKQKTVTDLVTKLAKLHKNWLS